MKRRVLFVPMHLSTGGSPKWLLELIRQTMLQNEVFVVEFNDYGSFDIHKNQIKELIGKKSYTCLGGCFSDDWENERMRLLKIIENFDPHIVHFNEIPENFEYNGFPEELLKKIYKKDRTYRIIETSHDNSFDFNKKRFNPDAFVCVSEYHREKTTEATGVKSYIWDYEIPKQEKKDRKKTLEQLGLDPKKMHVLNVGLFHLNKNQKYIFDLAEEMLDENIQFHFIGNECYKGQCEINDLELPNCKIWGERADVDSFYSSMDLFLFPSHRELNPICVKEALAWGIPVIMNKIESCDLYKRYENNPDVEFICDINVKERVLDIAQKYGSPRKNPEAERDFTIALYTSFYNNAKYIPGLYEQIRNQTYDKWKWFVTDDFSKDNVVKRELMELASKDKRVIYCEQKTKKEMFWNAQHFITEDCDYLALCDADDGIYPKALEFLNHMLIKNPEAFSFSTWFHQYKDNVEDKGNVTNSDFSYPRGDWYTYLNKHEEDLKNKGFDWEYLRSFRFFGALRGHKNIKGVEIDINKPEKSVYEDSTRMSMLQKYGDYILFPRPMYKVLNHDASHASSHNMDPEEHKVSKDNLYEAIKKGEPYKDNKILDRYYPFFDELCALSLSGIHHEKDRKNLCLITNKPITKRQSDDIQDLYFDHNFYVNTFNNQIDYFFLDINSFDKEELRKVFRKINKLTGSFEVNAYYLLDKETKENIDAAVQTINQTFHGMRFSWTTFCRNLVFKFIKEASPALIKGKVLIELGSGSLGDCIAWAPYAEEFRKINGCDVYCLTDRNDLYRNSYPDVKFIERKDKEKHTFDKEYKVGWYDDTPKEVKNREEQYTASYYLGLKHKEVKPKIDIHNKERNIEGKYVCISVHSTSQCKYWNNPEGWNKTVSYLNQLGYKVVCIDKQSSFGNDTSRNYIPEGVINKTGDFPLQERITDIHNCEFFIGLGSGLSWLAWGLNKDVVLISGFSNEKTEFYTPYRVINKDVCNSCWNEEEFDKSNWLWCPRHEGTEREFECSKKISFEMVRGKIDAVRVNQLYLREGWGGTFIEVYIRDTYQKHVSVEEGDYVVDLGCSMGVFYFKNKHKNIDYVGIEAAQKNLGKFSSLLTSDDNLTLMNRIVIENETGIVKTEKNDFDGGRETEAEAISFEEILKLRDRKIDFLKFDVEGAEVELLNNDETYELFVKNVSKFSGELHDVGGNAKYILTPKSKTSTSLKILKKLKNDKRVDSRISSIDGIDITNLFWKGIENERHAFYSEVIISGKIL